MSLSPLFRLVWMILAVVNAANLVAAQSQNCISRLEDIFNAETLLTEQQLTEQRIYTLCPNTVFRPGPVDQNGAVISGDAPLATRSNAETRCGNTGKPTNNCTITGTGTYGIFAMSLLVYGEASMENVVFKGLTIDSWIGEGQIPVLVGADQGKVTFTECVFKNNKGDPLFLIDQFPLDVSNRALLDGDKGRFKYNYDPRKHNRRLSELPEHMKAGVALIDSGRQLQGQGAQPAGEFEVEFDKCKFTANQAATNPDTQGGLSVVRIRAADPYNPFDQVGTMKASFVRNEFSNNNFSSGSDGVDYRSMIDHYSTGELILSRNCWTESPVYNYGPITAQSSVDVTSEFNFAAQQPGLECNFVAFVTDEYELVGCGDPAESQTCQAVPIGICFPTIARVVVEGKGEVSMDSLALGDRVMVDRGRFEPIYSFGHRNENVKAEYLRIVTERLVSLDISKEHMVFVEGGRSVPASMVRISDKLQLANGEYDAVIGITGTEMTGAYAPFTPSGTLVVNAVKTSNFIAFQRSETLFVAGVDTGLTYQFLAHSFELPHRLWCRYISSCKTERYTPDGVSTWVALPHDAARWFLAQNSLVMAVLYVPVLILFAVLAYPVASFTFLAGFFFISLSRRSRISSS